MITPERYKETMINLNRQVYETRKERAEQMVHMVDDLGQTPKQVARAWDMSISRVTQILSEGRYERTHPRIWKPTARSTM
jgi:hypothetical protein